MGVPISCLPMEEPQGSVKDGRKDNRREGEQISSRDHRARGLAKIRYSGRKA